MKAAWIDRWFGRCWHGMVFAADLMGVSSSWSKKASKLVAGSHQAVLFHLKITLHDLPFQSLNPLLQAASRHLFIRSLELSSFVSEFWILNTWKFGDDDDYPYPKIEGCCAVLSTIFGILIAPVFPKVQQQDRHFNFWSIKIYCKFVANLNSIVEKNK